MMGMARPRRIVPEDEFVEQPESVAEDAPEADAQDTDAQDTDAQETARAADAQEADEASTDAPSAEAQQVDATESEDAQGAEDDADTEGRPEELRLIEALLFAAGEPLDEKTLRKRLPDGIDVPAALRRLQQDYAPRGVNLIAVAGKWTFRTANDLAWLLSRETVEPKKLSRAAIETLAIVAYHQPVTRAEIEEIRGVSTSKGTVDVLLETGWIKPRGRRKAPGRPLTYGTTDNFLGHFGLENVGDLPGLDELKGTGLFDGRLPAGFNVPVPSDDAALREDEDPLEPGDLDLGLAPRVSEDEGGSD